MERSCALTVISGEKGMQASLSRPKARVYHSVRPLGPFFGYDACINLPESPKMADENAHALQKRREAERARELATSMTDRDTVASLTRYAEKCETAAVLLERQIAEARENIDRSQGLRDEIEKLVGKAHSHVSEMRRTLKVPAGPSRLPAAVETFRCLDCGKVTERPATMGYECPDCGSLDSIVADGRE